MSPAPTKIGAGFFFVLYFLFFCSGLSGLIYQIVWVRVFGNVFGNTVSSAAVVVAVFMLGLGVGSWVAGVWADRRYDTRPGGALGAYGRIEFAVAAWGAALSFVLPHLEGVSAALTSYVTSDAGWFVVSSGSALARAGVAVALLTPMTLLMGATLTLLIRHLVRANPEAERGRIAGLYAVNTAGAAVACLLTDFFLVPAWGLRNAQLMAAACNVLAGVGALWLARTAARLVVPATVTTTVTTTVRTSVATGGRPRPSRARTQDLPSSGGLGPGPTGGALGASISPQVVLVSVALALSGCAALGMEIIWFRHFSIMLGAFRAVFSLLLAVILVGIGTGAVSAGVVQRYAAKPIRWLIATQALFVVSAMAGLAGAESSSIDQTVAGAIHAFGDTLQAPVARAPGTAGELWFNLRPMLPEVAIAAFLMGFSFPLANGVIQDTERAVGRRAGLLYLANTVGAVIGSVAAAFFLLPAFGLQAGTTVLMVTAACGLVPLVVLDGRLDRQGGAGSRGSGVALALAAPAAVAIACWSMLPPAYVTSRALPRPGPDERVLTQTEGVDEIVTVTETANKGRTLMTNGHSMSATWPLSQRYMRALAHVPLLMLESPKRALVIGFGVGNTTAAATLHPSIERVDVADLSRNVLSHASWFSGSNGNVLKDPRVAVYVNDGRHHLRLQPAGTYDLIALEPPPIGYAGVASLYSEEFYRLARTRLTPGGFISQWLPSYQVPTDTTLSMIRAFVDVFPQAVLLSGAQADLILIGANDRIGVDPDRLLSALSARPSVRADLSRLDLGTPREIVGMFLGSATTLAAATRDAVPVTDDRPVQEYGVRSLLNLGEFVPASVVDLTGVAGWCPRCFDDQGMPTRAVEGLDLYLALLGRAYAATPAEGARARREGESGRLFAGSAYLGTVVPESAGAHSDLGVAFAARGQMDRAIGEFREAVRLEPDSAPSHWHLGAALADRGALNEALDHLRRSVQLDPSNVDAQHDLEAVTAATRSQNPVDLTP